MKQSLFVRGLTAQERQMLKATARLSDEFARRRAQVVLASAAGQRPAQIGATVGCGTQSVRNAIHAFDDLGIASLTRRSSRPTSRVPVLTPEKLEQVLAIIRAGPGAFGRRCDAWTLALLAQVCCEQALTPRPLSVESMRHALNRLGVDWKLLKRQSVGAS